MGYSGEGKCSESTRVIPLVPMTVLIVVKVDNRKRLLVTPEPT
jgi:hypothetical protein